MTLSELIKEELDVRIEMWRAFWEAMNKAGSPGGCNSKERVMKREGNLGRPVKGMK